MRVATPTQLHLVTGKGGVGKSTFAAALTKCLADENKGPILLIEVQGSGRSLEILGLEDHLSYNIQPVPEMNQAWACRILPQPAFRQYFTLLLAMGHHDSTFAQLTSSLRSKLVDTILNNKVVSAFVDVCPGLEPAALLGKIHWECTEGRVPEHEIPWKHVVVDAPSTGHATMLFKSTQALVDVFGTGVVFNQASEIMKLMKDPQLTRLYLLSTPEELPLKETSDLSKTLHTLGLPQAKFILNRQRPLTLTSNLEDLLTEQILNQNPQWGREAVIEIERTQEESVLIQNFLKDVQREQFDLRLPELAHAIEDHQQLSQICRQELQL